MVNIAFDSNYLFEEKFELHIRTGNCWPSSLCDTFVHVLITLGFRSHFNFTTWLCDLIFWKTINFIYRDFERININFYSFPLDKNYHTEILWQLFHFLTWKIVTNDVRVSVWLMSKIPECLELNLIIKCEWIVFFMAWNCFLCHDRWQSWNIS